MGVQSNHGKREKILLVDDERSVVDSLKELLFLEGYEVDSADSGEEGILRLESAGNTSRFYDLVLTDLVMPPLDGMKVLEKAREIDPEIVVILMTGYATIESAVYAIRNGAYEYLLKPFLIPDLMLTIERGLEKRRLFNENRRLIEDLRDKNTALQDTLAKLKQAQNQLIHFAQKHAVTETVTNLKHEIINPLTSIISRAQLIMEQNHPEIGEEMVKYLQVIQTQSVRISKIVANLDKTMQAPMLTIEDAEKVLANTDSDGN
ncbi:response regulator [bacterium]|nr:response regulator [candidate division CSSED10-310 bacterium]